MTKYTIVSDVHTGNHNANRKAFRTALRKAEKIIILGDMIEGITKKDKRHGKDTILTVDEQIIEVKSDLKPYRKKIVKAFEGNHESSVLSKMDIDVSKLIYEPLGIPQGLTEVLNLDGIKCFFTHGSGMGTTYAAATTKLINYSRDHTADYYFMGHSHKLFDMDIQHNPNPYTIVNTGTFLRQAEYAIRMGFPNSICGYYILDTKGKGSLEKVVIK